MDKSKLLSGITGSMVCGWDVLCSYDEEKINHVLAEKFEKKPETMVSCISYKKERENKLRKVIEQHEMTIHLKAPKLEFIIGERNICQVDMPIEHGSYTLSEKKKEDERFTKLGEEEIEENQVILRCFVPLSATEGDGIYNKEGKISFVEGDKTSKIYLHFKHTDLTAFKLVPCSEEVRENSILFDPVEEASIIESLLFSFLESVDEIQYELGAVSNVTSSSNELIPKSFVFAAYKAAESELGCLNIYIQTQNTEFQQGDLTPAFLVSGSSVAPFPDDFDEKKKRKYSAALYIKKEVLLDKMIRPNLPKNISAEYGVDDEKRLLILYYLDKEITIPKIEHIPGVSLLKSEDTVFNMKDAPIKLLFDGKYMEISWTYTFTNSFKGKIGFGMSSMHISEKATVTVTYEDTIDISNLSAEELEVSFNLADEKKYKFDIKTKIGGFPGLFSNHGEKTDLENHLDNKLPFDVSDIKLDISPIGVFAVANILMPGKHVFQFNHEHGVYRPDDIILFGNVIDSLED